MQARIHGGRRRRSSEIPWLFVATIIGIVVVAGAAVIYFTNGGGSSAGPASSSDMVVIEPTTSVPATASSSAAANPSPTFAIVSTTPPNVPATGVAVSVSYIGGYNGSYSTGGVTTTLTGSGSQMYQVVNATGSVTAIFQKTDSTATHPLTVSIFENGNQLATDSTSASYGKVTVTANV
jgi:hypothetical protein